jgi:protein TonB
MKRLIIGVCLSAITTLSLLLLMQYLIQGDNANIADKKNRNIADIYMSKIDIDVDIDRKKTEKPELSKAPPQSTEVESSNIPIQSDLGIHTVPLMPNLSMGKMAFTGPQLSASDGEYLPMIKVQPQYPSRALSRGIEGICIVEYTVTKTGAVRDAVALECSPLFKTASVQAALKFKYKPRIENGEPVEVFGVRNQFTYKIAK